MIDVFPQVNNYETNIEDPPELVAENPMLQQFKNSYQIGAGSEPGFWIDFIDRSNLSMFKSQAYSNPDGLAVRVNPQTGLKELFVSGTRSPIEWIQNVQETGQHVFESVTPLLDAKGGADKARTVYTGETIAAKSEALNPEGFILMEMMDTEASTSEFIRDQYAAYIDELITELNIDVVYGHSRGAATISGLKSDVYKIGLDGAMFIAHPDSDILNISNESSFMFGFDEALVGGYKNNITLKKRAFHDVTLPKGAGHSVRKEPTLASLKRVQKRKRKSSPFKKVKKFWDVTDHALMTKKILPRRPVKKTSSKLVHKRKMNKRRYLQKRRTAKRTKAESFKRFFKKARAR